MLETGKLFVPPSPTAPEPGDDPNGSKRILFESQVKKRAALLYDMETDIVPRLYGTYLRQFDAECKAMIAEYKVYVEDDNGDQRLEDFATDVDQKQYIDGFL